MFRFHPGHRAFLLISAVLLLITGCGAPAATTTVSSDSAATSAAPDSAASPAATTASSATRTITHAMGTTDVPANPQRVVVLDTGELDSALALGVKPVGAVEALPGTGFLAYLRDRTEGVQNVGTIAEPNLETIATLQPDLILSSKARHEDIYEQLSQIAPTVFTERVGVVWKENLKAHAEALNKSAEAEQLIQTYDQRIAGLRSALGDRLSDTEVSIVRFLPGQIRLYQRGSFIGTIMDDIGLARPASQQAQDETWLEGSQERIDDFDGDLLFVTSYGPAEETVLPQLKANPLWAQLDAVQQNTVHEVSDDHWMTGIGILAANRVIDDLETILK